MPTKLPPYDALPLLPFVIAETVCATPYTGSEGSNQSGYIAQKTEQARQRLTADQVQEFADLCDRRCRAAYEKRAKWFVACARAESNQGRDQLYVWITHWLASYLNNPVSFRARAGV